jgi:hypothetical protein
LSGVVEPGSKKAMAADGSHRFLHEGVLVSLPVFVFWQKFPKWAATVTFLQYSCAFQLIFTLLL